MHKLILQAVDICNKIRAINNICARYDQRHDNFVLEITIKLTCESDILNNIIKTASINIAYNIDE